MMTERDTERLLTQVATAIHAGLTPTALFQAPGTAALIPEGPRAVFLDTIQRGGTLTDAFAAIDVLAPAELALLRAAEQGGTLDRALPALADAVAARRRARAATAARFAYPILLLCAASVFLPLPLVVTAGFGAWIKVALPIPLLAVSLAVVYLVVAPRTPRDGPLRRWPRRFLQSLPFARRAAEHMAHATFARVLGDAIAAGLGMHEAVPLAASAADHPDVARASRVITRSLQAGSTLGEALERSRAFRPIFVAAVANGEVSGTLDRALTVLARDEDEAGRRLSRTVSVIVGAIVALGVVIAVGFGIVRGFTGYLDEIDRQIFETQ